MWGCGGTRGEGRVLRVGVELEKEGRCEMERGRRDGEIVVKETDGGIEARRDEMAGGQIRR